MPHYKDGTETKVGDVVRGKGYNLKDADGNLREFVGTVVGVTPGSASCNIQVAHIEARELPESIPLSDYVLSEFLLKGVKGSGPNGNSKPSMGGIVRLEYGQCDHFEKIA